MSASKALPGVWTPWADLICLKCHGPVYRGERRFEEDEFNALCAPREREGDEDIARCDKCKCEVWERASVAVCANLRDLINDANGALVAKLTQTGGMCVGTEIRLANDPTSKHYVLATDGVDGGGPDGTVFLGLYDTDLEDEDGSGYVCNATFEADSVPFADVAARVVDVLRAASTATVSK